MSIHHAGQTKLTLTLPAGLRRRIDARVARQSVTISSFMHAVAADFHRRYNGTCPRYLATKKPYVTFQVWMTDDLVSAFKAKAQADGVSQSSLLLTAVEEYLSQRPRK